MFSSSCYLFGELQLMILVADLNIQKNNNNTCEFKKTAFAIIIFSVYSEFWRQQAFGMATTH